jgi:hypothetical protein
MSRLSQELTATAHSIRSSFGSMTETLSGSVGVRDWLDATKDVSIQGYEPGETTTHNLAPPATPEVEFDRPEHSYQSS